LVFEKFFKLKKSEFNCLFFRMPPPFFGISPGLTILSASQKLKKRGGNMSIKYRKRHSRKSRSHSIARSKVGGRARRRKHRRRRHRKTHTIPSHPGLFT
jgi:hypothetical protein